MQAQQAFYILDRHEFDPFPRHIRLSFLAIIQLHINNLRRLLPDTVHCNVPYELGAEAGHLALLPEPRVQDHGDRDQAPVAGVDLFEQRVAVLPVEPSPARRLEHGLCERLDGAGAAHEPDENGRVLEVGNVLGRALCPVDELEAGGKVMRVRLRFVLDVDLN